MVLTNNIDKLEDALKVSISRSDHRHQVSRCTPGLKSQVASKKTTFQQPAKLKFSYMIIGLNLDV
jgi:hypothetical protein